MTSSAARQNAGPVGAPRRSNSRIRRRIVILPVSHSTARIVTDFRELSKELA